MVTLKAPLVKALGPGAHRRSPVGSRENPPVGVQGDASEDSGNLQNCDN